MKVKSLLKSNTFWGAVGSFVWFCYTLSEPYIAGEKVLDPKEIYFLIGAMGFGLYTIYGRYTANAIVFTPPALPGRNRADAIRQAKGIESE